MSVEPCFRAQVQPQKCPACKRRDLDAKGICWDRKCDYRRCCECGGSTHSQFIQTCNQCAFAERGK